MLLSIGKQIDRYRIVKLLGAGGMGEVYLAFDNRLEREVTIKVLKKNDSSESLRRFKQEVRAISALNHPNILSIYEFGQHESFHYIVAEFIRGKTLRQVIQEGKLTLAEACEIAIQIGNTLIAAHEEKIIHRDIKPENVMIRPDGYIKVLDFGLAKLDINKKNLLAEQDESTLSFFQQTQPGLLVGTINYMSPEQLRVQQTDTRTDIWSLGVIFFEMTSGRHPFLRESVNDTIAAILEHDPPVISDILPGVPSAALESLFGKALAKKREARFSNALELVKDLQTLKLLFSADSTSPSVTSTLNTSANQITASNNAETISNSSTQTISDQKFNYKRLSFLIAGLLIFTAIGFGFYNNLFSLQRAASKQIKTKFIATAGNVLNAVISPNGQFILYVQEEHGTEALRLRQVNELGDTILVPADNVSFSGIQFSPDGNNVFYTVFKDSPTGELYRKPVLGGAAQKIADDVDSTVSFSPNGNQLAFIRSKSHEGVDQVIISDTNGSNMQVVFERHEPNRYLISIREGLSWSPDGTTIACAAGTADDSGEKMTIVKIDIAKKTETEATQQKWFRVGKIQWLKDGDSLIFTAADFGSDRYQIWRLSVSNNQVERITTELNDYQNISLTNDSKTLLAVADDKTSNLYVGSSKSPNQSVQIAGGNQDGLGGIAWTPDDRILYVSEQSGKKDIWIMDKDGSNHHPLTFDKSSNEYPSISNDGKSIAFVSSQTGVPHVWMMNTDGTNLRQLTNKSGEAFPQIMPDGKAVLYSAKPLKVWQALTDNPENPKPITETPVNWITISPDGSKFAGLTMEPGLPMKLSIFLTKTGQIIDNFNIVGQAGDPTFPPILRWTPDGKSIAYISTENEVSNIVIQSLQQRTVKKLTDFSADRIFAFDFSRDGNTIAFARGVARNKLLLFEGF